MARSRSRVRVSPLDSPTRIVATLGPATSSEATLRKLLSAGVDVVRLNMSHGEHGVHREVAARVRRVARALGRPVGVLVDLQGPKVRTARNEGGGKIPLRRGEEVELAFGRGRSRPGHLVVDFAGLAKDLQKDDDLLLDDGKLVLRVTSATSTTLRAKVVRGGPLKERAGVNVPGRRLRVSIPTRKDRDDLRFALELDADFVALSFVQSAKDVTRLRTLIGKHLGTTTSSRERRGFGGPAIIAKIEKPAALRDLDAILDAADGVMVARGDLGVELSLPKVPLWQKEILRRARKRGAYTITATQMLESMIGAASPTRAEVSDVANAIFDGTDAVMLSAETAVGDYPVEAVRTLTEVASEVDREVLRLGHFTRLREEASLRRSSRDAVVRAAVDLAESAGARWIVTLTLRGTTTRLLARHRPSMGILALTPHEDVERRMCLLWNTRTVRVPYMEHTYKLMTRGLELLREARLVKKDDVLVIVSGDANMPEATNLVRLVQVS